MDGKIQNFTDLLAWKEGHKLVLLIYSVSKSFPKEEIFGLTSQMRRCAVSVSSNVAEGFSRQSYKEKIHFYSISLGSITELQNQLLISKDIGYITPEIFKKIVDQTISVQKLTNGLIKFSKSQLLNT